uniref:TolC family protein n=1 Tax=Gracilinema caldarium TaxID=215591 RepID=A0A7C3IJQ1_9SPIR
MKTFARFAFPIILAFIILLLKGPALYAFDTLDDLVSRSIAQNLDVQQAALTVKSSAASLSGEISWRSSSVGLTASTSGSFDTGFGPGSPGTVATPGTTTTINGTLSVPLTDWFTLGASGTIKADGSVTSSFSANLNPLAEKNSKGSINYQMSLQSYRSTLRSAVLQFRAQVRSLLVSKAEVAYKQAALDTATAQYEQKQILSAQGSASQSDVLDVLVSLTQARLDYEAADSNYQTIQKSLAQSLGLSETELPDFEKLVSTEPDITEDLVSAIMDRSTYLAMSDTYVRAVLDAASSQIDERTAQPKPDINIKGELSPTAKTWSAGATVKLPLDLLFWEKARIAKEMAEVKQKEVQLASQTVSQDYDQKVRDLRRLYESWKKTATAYDSAKLVYEQVGTLASLGQKSLLDVMSGKADLLRSAWQLASAEKAFRDAQDALSMRFFYIEEK